MNKNEMAFFRQAFLTLLPDAANHISEEEIKTFLDDFSNDREPTIPPAIWTAAAIALMATVYGDFSRRAGKDTEVEGV